MGSSEEAKNILTPILSELKKQRDAHNFEKVSEFYDQNAVHVHAGEAVYGKDAINEHSKKFLEKSGKLTTKLSNEKFDMAGDFIILTSDYETQTEKIGVLKGKFTQIWRKNNDTYLLLHIEYVPQ
ncbi:unnamed protein product [Cylicocyclus nassatus]|uniref:DUF4440 domain-containing protein n=1 Tax=Cylicocyclus nassatus TaxID=53992 RepID=A0AA36H585_CYLNA|nr:unnamed protein product [Cylicocyclus nassatus]